MRSMNKIELVSPHLAILGPGSIWYEVLQEISPLRYTMLHGQCERLPKNKIELSLPFLE